MQANNQNVLLANVSRRYSGLHLRIWRWLSLESRQIQALQWFSFFASSDLSLKKPVERFHNRSSPINGFKRKQLWRFSLYHKPTYVNDQAWASKDHNRCSLSSRDYYQYNSNAWQLFQLYCQWLKLTIHLKVLVFTMLFFWH